MTEQIFRTTLYFSGDLSCVGCVDDNGIIYDTSEPVYLHSVGCVTPDGEVYETTTKTLGGQIGYVDKEGYIFDVKQGLGFGRAIGFFNRDNDLKLLYSNGAECEVRVGYVKSSSVYARGAAVYFLLKGMMGQPQSGYRYAWEKLNAEQPANETNSAFDQPENTYERSASGESIIDKLGIGVIGFFVVMGLLMLFLKGLDKHPTLGVIFDIAVIGLIVYGVYRAVTKNMTPEQRAAKFSGLKNKLKFSGFSSSQIKSSIKNPFKNTDSGTTSGNSFSPYTQNTTYTQTTQNTQSTHNTQSSNPFNSVFNNPNTGKTSSSSYTPYASSTNFGKTFEYNTKTGDPSTLPPEANPFIDMFTNMEEVKTATRDPGDPEHVFLTCECGVRLRFPADRGTLEYTCPKCSRKGRVFTGERKQ